MTKQNLDSVRLSRYVLVHQNLCTNQTIKGIDKYTTKTNMRMRMVFFLVCASECEREPKWFHNVSYPKSSVGESSLEVILMSLLSGKSIADTHTKVKAYENILSNYEQIHPYFKALLYKGDI